MPDAIPYHHVDFLVRTALARLEAAVRQGGPTVEQLNAAMTRLAIANGTLSDWAQEIQDREERA